MWRTRGGKYTHVAYIPRLRELTVDLSLREVPPTEAMRVCLRVLRELAPEASSGFVWRAGGETGLLPYVPIAETDALHAVLTTEAAVSEAYEHPEVFWSVWDTVESYGETKLVVRGAEHLESSAFFAYIYEGHRALARAAKPGRCDYEDPRVTDIDRSPYEAGESRLRPVGYIESEARMELSCVLGTGEHIAGWEIDAVGILLRAGRMQDGAPLREARVTFSEEGMARRERTPLLDVGARVFYLADSGELVELTS
ncbi:MAG: hypothetical protein AB7S26_02065 [Sandaracinaceae bacterium]